MSKSSQAAKDVELILYRLRPRLFQVDETPAGRVNAVKEAKAALLKVLLEGRPEKKLVDGTERPLEQYLHPEKVIAQENKGYSQAIDEYDNFIKSVLGGEGNG